MSFQLRTLSLNGRAPRYDHDASITSLLIRNTFLVFRLAFLILLTNFSFLTLIFAAWNLNATRNLGLKATSTSIFIIFESCLTFACVIFASLDFVRPNLMASRTLFECIWVIVLYLFQMGGAISTAVNGPALVCHATSDWNVCASASLLIPTTWLNAFLTLAYFFVLFISVMTHKSTYPHIWTLPVHSVQWFSNNASDAPLPPPKDFKLKGKASSNDVSVPRYEEEDPYADWYEDVESTTDRKKMYPIRHSVEENIPSGPHWAPPAIRRGLDQPFSTQPSTARSSPAGAMNNISLPSLPPPSAKSGSRYIERFRDSLQFFGGASGSKADGPARPPPDVPGKFFAKHYHAHKTSFPESVDNDDHPIPLPHLSEWIRADASLNGQSRYPMSPTRV